MVLRRVKLIPATTATVELGDPSGPIPVISIDDQTGTVYTAGKSSSPTINAQSTNYIAALGDANNVVEMTSGSANTFTVPPNSNVAFIVGTTLTVIQGGAGQVTLTPGAGVTIQTPSSLTTRAQWSAVAVVQISANVWVAGGDLT